MLTVVCAAAWVASLIVRIRIPTWPAATGIDAMMVVIVGYWFTTAARRRNGGSR